MGGGKSSAARILRSRGYAVVDADQVVHELMAAGSEVAKDIYSTFGESVKGRDGAVDRRALGRAVFGSPEKLDKLEKILHPRVRERVADLRRGLEASGAQAAFYDVPLLFEKKMEPQFDYILVVSARAELRLQRLMERTGLSEAEIKARWQTQLSAEYKETHANAVVWNNGSLQELEEALTAALTQMGILPAVAKP